MPDILQQNEYSCGISATQLILAYYGEDIEDIDLEKELNVDPEFGVATKDIVSFFKKKGYKVKEGSTTIDKIKHFIDLGLPSILFIQAWSSEETTDWIHTNEWGHYVVAIGYNDKGIIFEDSAIFGRGFLSYEELEKRLHGID